MVMTRKQGLFYVSLPQTKVFICSRDPALPHPENKPLDIKSLGPSVLRYLVSTPIEPNTTE
jgi:hypothetical protein